jgi:hypothetical protein
VITRADLDRWFVGESIETAAAQAIGSAARDFASEILRLTPSSPDQSASLRKVREAYWTARESLVGRSG